jgi:hypothetical protein
VEARLISRWLECASRSALSPKIPKSPRYVVEKFLCQREAQQRPIAAATLHQAAKRVRLVSHSIFNYRKKPGSIWKRRSSLASRRKLETKTLVLSGPAQRHLARAESQKPLRKAVENHLSRGLRFCSNLCWRPARTDPRADARDCPALPGRRTVRKCAHEKKLA